MGGDVVIGLIVFRILLVVNFMVITKGSGRIAEVAARFSLDAMPGKQMAIDAEMSAGLIDEKIARRRRKDLEEESGFYGAMDGAAKFVRGDAIAGLIITVINILGGLAIGVVRHGMPFVRRHRRLHHADRGRRAGLADPRAAGLHRGRHRGDQGRHRRLRRRGAGAPARRQPEAAGDGRRRGRPCWRCCPDCRRCRSWRWPGWRAAAPGCATSIPPASAPNPRRHRPSPPSHRSANSLRIDLIRLELGYGLLALAGGETRRG